MLKASEAFHAEAALGGCEKQGCGSRDPGLGLEQASGPTLFRANDVVFLLAFCFAVTSGGDDGEVR